MNWTRQWTLIKYDFLLDFRHRFSIGSVLLYAVFSVFLCLIAYQDPELEAWNLLYWVLLSFSAVIWSINVYAKETSEHRLYYFQLLRPQELWLAKWVSGTIFLLLIALLLCLSLMALSYDPIIDWRRQLAAMGLSSLTLAAILSFTSAIGSLSDSPAVVSSIISLPLILPVLLLGQYLTGVAMDLRDPAAYNQYMMYLAAITVIASGGAMVLINFVWKN